jgi:predicted  nucleic acid-binding Zn-ribbon protein
MNFQIGFQLDASLDPRKLNQVLSVIKKSLGSLGDDIQLLSDDDIAAFEQMQAELKAAQKAAEDVDDALGDVGDKVKNINQETKESFADEFFKPD